MNIEESRACLIDNVYNYAKSLLFMQGLKVSNYSRDFVIFSIKLETLEAVVFKQLRNKATASYIQENCNWTFDTKTKRNFCKNLNSARFQDLL